MRSIRSFVAVLALVALAIPSPAAAATGASPAGEAGQGGAASQRGAAILGGAPLSSVGPSDASVTLTGTLEVTVTDGRSGSQRTFHSILTDAGRVRLHISGEDVSALAGARVSLTGERGADGSVSVAAAAIRVLEPAARRATSTTPGYATPAATTETTAVIIGRWNDYGGDPVTKAEAETAFINDAASVNNYFATTSRGRMTMTSTVYGPWPLGVSQCAGGSDFDLFDLTIAAALAAAAAHGVSLAGYDHVFVWMREPVGSCAVSWAGMGSIGGPYVLMVMDGPTIDPGVYGWPWDHAQIASHELDHNIGLYHSNAIECWSGTAQVTLATDCRSLEYADQYSTMGIAGAPINVLLDADRLDSMGWLDSSEKQTLSSVGTYTLVPTYSAAAGVRLIRISRPDPPIFSYETSGYWTLEIRSDTGGAFDKFSSYPSMNWATTGVTIRLSQDGPGLSAKGYSQLVDASPTATKPPGLTWSDLWNAPLQPGSTFADPAGGITITVNSVTGSGAIVTIGDTEAPTAPPSLTATALTPQGARLNWTAASDNLGLALYRILRDGTQIAEVSGTTLTYTDSTASGGHHTYGVKAVDTAGLESAPATAEVDTIGPPGAPTAVTAVAGNAAAMVYWTAPANLGDPITAYTVTSSPEGKTCIAAATWCMVDGLANGTPYTFTVTATNGYGTGPASAPSNQVTPTGTVATRPTAVVAAPGDGTVDVSWTASSDAGSGGPITSYTATSSPGSKTCTTPNGSTTTCAVTDLTNGTAYTFTVTAANSLGTSLPSNPSAAATPRTVPDAPTTVTALGKDVSATVSWSVPAFNGGAAIDSYRVTASPDGATCTTATLSCTVPGLTNRTSYTFTVVAHNVAGDGAASSASAAAVPLAGATYFTVTPNRLVDSRTPLGLTGWVTHNSPVSFQVTNRKPSEPAKNIPTGAIAVTGNLTVTGQTSLGYLALTPTRPVGQPEISTLNFPKGDNRANAVTVPLGGGGELWVTYWAGQGAHAHVVFDVTGYFVAGPAGATYLAVAPNRLADSRTPLGLTGWLTHNSPVSFQVTNRKPSEPAKNVLSDAIAVTGNLTVTGQTYPGYLALTPARPVGQPEISTLNFPRGDNRANAVTVPLGSGGELWVTYWAIQGAHTHVVFDVSGYFTMR
jgi:hypothetical protein